MKGVERLRAADATSRCNLKQGVFNQSLGSPQVPQAFLLHLVWRSPVAKRSPALPLERLDALEGAVSYGPRGQDRVGVVAFNVVGVHPHDMSVHPHDIMSLHPHDIASFLDEDGVCVRAGHHCAQPAMRAVGVQATARPSFGVHSTEEDVDALITSLERRVRFFAEA